MGDVNDETYDHYGRDSSLKYLEISGYSGFDSERKLALHLINNITSFQKLIVVACDEEALARAFGDFRHITSIRSAFIVI